MKKMIIVLENNGSKYEIYMRGIHRSNYDNTIVRWEAEYNHIQELTTGASVTYGNRIHKLEQFISDLLSKGYK
jgi:hypothetical protein